MKQKFTLPILTTGHFIVDLACLYFYFTNFPQSGLVKIISAALLYNFLAFALQAPIGYFFDKYPARRSTTIGILFLICGYAFGLFHHPITGLILCGFGNAFYHVGGSIGIARTDKKGLKDSGIFVSAGALGVSMGTWLAGYLLPNNFFSETTFCILLLLIVLFVLQKAVTSPLRKNTTPFSAGTNAALLLLSLFAVLIRSLGGLFFPVLYKEVFSFTQVLFLKSPALYLFLTAMTSGIVAFLGKFLGGFLSCFCDTLIRKLFPKKQFDLRSCNYIFGTITLLVSMVFFSLGSKTTILQTLGNKPAFCFLGVLCFHAAMPVTLFELYCILPDRPGFAMGLSTVMLFLGYLPYAFVPLDGLPASKILFILTLLAVACMLASLLIYCKANHKNKQKRDST